MVDRVRIAGRTLGVAMAGALLLTAVAAGNGAGASPRDCQVFNLDQGGTASSLQDAVSAASSGDHLALTGKCVGITLVDKSLSVSGRRIRSSSMICDRGGRCRVTGVIDSGPPTITSDSGRPSLVIDPSVVRLRVAGGVTVRSGMVVGDTGAWDPAGAAAEAWSRWSPSLRLRATIGKPRACRVRNRDTKAEFGGLRRAIWKASAGERLVMQGTCKGTTYIGKDLSIHGVRKAKSARRDPGAPTIRSNGPGPAIIVGPDVEDLALKRVTIRGGLAIGDTAAYRRFVAGR